MDRREIYAIVFIILGAGLLVAPIYIQMSSGTNVRVQAEKLNESHPYTNIVENYPNDIYKGVKSYRQVEGKLDKVDENMTSAVGGAIDSGSSHLVVNNQEASAVARYLGTFNITKGGEIYSFNFSAVEAGTYMNGTEPPIRNEQNILMVNLTVNASSVGDIQSTGMGYRITPLLNQDHRYMEYDGKFYNVTAADNATVLRETEWSSVLGGLSRNFSGLTPKQKKIVEGTAGAGSEFITQNDVVQDLHGNPLVSFNKNFYFLRFQPDPEAIKMNTFTMATWIVALLSVLFGLLNAYKLYREE